MRKKKNHCLTSAILILSLKGRNLSVERFATVRANVRGGTWIRYKIEGVWNSTRGKKTLPSSILALALKGRNCVMRFLWYQEWLSEMETEYE